MYVFLVVVSSFGISIAVICPGLMTRRGPENHVLDGGQDLPVERGNFLVVRGGPVWPVLSLPLRKHNFSVIVVNVIITPVTNLQV